MSSDVFSKYYDDNESQEDPFSKYYDSKTSQRGTPNTPASTKVEPNFLQRGYNTISEYGKKGAQENRNRFKSFASGATAGISEAMEPLELKEDQTDYPSYIAGTFLPIGLTAKALSYPFKALQGLTNFGKVGTFALKTVEAAAIGAVYGTEKETIKAARGKGFDPYAPAIEAAEFGALHALFSAAGPKVSQWINSLSKKQQAEILTKGILPDDLTPQGYKFWEQEVVPALQKEGKVLYETELENAVKKNDLEYQQKLNNTKAQHESQVYENENQFKEAQEDYQNQLKQLAAEHESKIQEIQQGNQEAEIAYQEQQRAFQEMAARQHAVEQSIQIKPGEENLPYREAPSTIENPSLENEVGNIISKNEPINSTNAGKANIEAVRANDAIDYQKVQEAYKLNDELNSKIDLIAPNLVQDLKATINELEKIPKLAPHQEQKLAFAKKLLEEIVILDEAGNIIGFKPINNRVLQEQAKSIRYYMDFNFEHGNARGILSPLVRQIENAVETSAAFVGDKAAIEASQNSRRMYSEWADAYDNPYIRPYRDSRNLDFSKTFNSSLNPDEFNQLNTILSRSNAGQQLAGSTRRTLVDKYLGKYLENPHTASPIEFNKTLRELRSVISGEEEQAIREAFNNARNKPSIKEPSTPKLKELPEKQNVPTFQGNKKEISQVKIPLKEEVRPTPAMKIASKMMEITPEEAMKLSKTPSGLKKLKSNTNKDVFEKIGKEKAREMAFQGQKKRILTGEEWKDVFNKQNNFDMFSEILGEKEAEELYQAFEKLGSKSVTVEALKVHLKHYAFVKTLLFFGLL